MTEETNEGTVIEALEQPRASFAGHIVETPLPVSITHGPHSLGLAEGACEAAICTTPATAWIHEQQGHHDIRTDAMSYVTVGTENGASIEDFFDNFYNVDKLAPERISEQAGQASFNDAAGASPCVTYACVDTWLTDDFRADLP